MSKALTMNLEIPHENLYSLSLSLFSISLRTWTRQRILKLYIPFSVDKSQNLQLVTVVEDSIISSFAGTIISKISRAFVYHIQWAGIKVIRIP